MRNTFFAIILLLAAGTQAQVGIGTTSPDESAVLDVSSNSQGVLLPKLTDAERDGILNPQNGLIIFNTTTNTLQYNAGTKASPSWESVASTPRHYVGKFIINATGNMTVTGIPFQPSMIKFTAYANVESYDLDSDNGVGNNNAGIPNAYGYMTGFATLNGVTIEEQVIYGGGSGNSINDISRYASSSHCIGLRYSDQNGNNLGLTTATLITFTSDGFTINVDSLADNVVVIFEAFR